MAYSLRYASRACDRRERRKREGERKDRETTKTRSDSKRQEEKWTERNTNVKNLHKLSLTPSSTLL